MSNAKGHKPGNPAGASFLPTNRTVEGAQMAEESWHEARLIPTSGINGADEQ
jgi:hypothetical protein